MLSESDVVPMEQSKASLVVVLVLDEGCFDRSWRHPNESITGEPPG